MRSLLIYPLKHYVVFSLPSLHVWMLFSESNTRKQAIAEYGNVSEATWQRVQGWAILFGVVLLDTGLIDNPRHAVLGERILRNLFEKE